MGQVGDGAETGGQEKLFLTLAEQLVRPLATMSRLSEGAPMVGLDAEECLRALHELSTSSLCLLEGYILSLRTQAQSEPLNLEPITISSLLYDTAERLGPLARQYGVGLELDTGPKMQPIVADRAILQSAFGSLGQVFVMAQAEIGDHTPVYLSAHRSRYGVVAGLYSKSAALGVDSLRRAQTVQGQARQPLQRFVSGPAAGVFVADSLLRALAIKLHVARYRTMTGLATTLQPSQQLQLV